MQRTAHRPRTQALAGMRSGDYGRRMRHAPIPFYAVQELAPIGTWRTVLLLFGRADAAHVVRAGLVKRRAVRIDLDTGWSERAVDHLVHTSGAEVQRSEFERWVWRFVARPTGTWDKTAAGHWHARWAALGYAVLEPG